MALTVHGELPPDLRNVLIPGGQMKRDVTAKISVDSRFVRVHLGGPNTAQIKRSEMHGGLWLNLKGMEPQGLESGAVFLPEAFTLDPAISINHAFTLLSERIEPWRLSHTGNIYERVFYLETNGIWYPLADLRDKELVSAERSIIKKLWDEVQKQFSLPLK